MMLKKVAKILGWTLVGIVVLAVATVGIGTAWLTPARLTRLVNDELSERLDADVRAVNVQYEFWSTFPYLNVSIDSLCVTSRALQDIPDSLASRLPADAALLMSSGRIKGSVNVRRLLSNHIELGDISADSLRVNLIGVSDSTANWNILPILKNPVKTPDISFSSVRLTHPQEISYLNIPCGCDIRAHLDSLAVTRSDNGKYRLALGGNLYALANGTHLVTGMPVALDGDLALTIQPLTVHTKNFNVDVNGMKMKFDLGAEIKDKPRITEFNFDIDVSSLDRLLSLMPAGLVPALEGLRADMPLQVEGGISAPYLADGKALPSMTLGVDIPSGSVSYNDVSLRDISMQGRLVYNADSPETSTIDIPRLNVRDGVTDLKVRALITDPTGKPTVQADIKGDLSLSKLGQLFRHLQTLDLSGKATSNTKVRFSMADLKDFRLDRMQVCGNAVLKGLQIGNLGNLDRLSADVMNIRFGADADSANLNDITGSLFDFMATVDNLSFDAVGYRTHATSVRLTSRIKDPGTVPLADLADNVPFNLDVKASTLSVGNPKDTLRVHVDGADVRGIISARLKGQLQARTYDVSVKGTMLHYQQGLTRFNINDLNTSIRAEYLNHNVCAPDFKTPAAWTVDDAATRFAKCTPRTIQFTASPQLRQIMARWRVLLRLRGSKGMLVTPAFPVRNYLDNIDISAGFDSIAIRDMSIRSESSSVTFSGGISNIRQFLTSTTPAPLRLNLTAAIDTLQCNELAAAYERGVQLTYGPGTVQRRLANNTIVAADSVAIMIPRNIYADIHASIGRCLYTDLQTYDWLGDIRVADGNLNIDSLAVHTDFVTAGAKLRLTTDDLEKIAFGAQIDADRLDITEFFRNFPKVLKAMPQMANLSGEIDAQARISTRIFPTMYVMLPATVGDVAVQGRRLELKQNRFIRKITRMMMIPTDNPLHIANLNINARMFDNLLTVQPFSISFDRYDLTIAGLNNFAGDIYYHIGVDKWPLSIPFGLNITGTTSHPEIRFGGERWKDSNATGITADIDNDIQLNVIQLAKKYGLLMIHKAAEADTTANYLF